MQTTHRDAIIGYLVFPYPFLARKIGDPFVRYHAYQALGGAIVGFALQGVISVLGYWIFTLQVYSLGQIILPLVWALRIFLVYLIYCGVMNVQAGKTAPLPWIGSYAQRLMK